MVEVFSTKPRPRHWVSLLPQVVTILIGLVWKHSDSWDSWCLIIIFPSFSHVFPQEMGLESARAFLSVPLVRAIFPFFHSNNPRRRFINDPHSAELGGRRRQARAIKFRGTGAWCWDETMEFHRGRPGNSKNGSKHINVIQCDPKNGGDSQQQVVS